MDITDTKHIRLPLDRGEAKLLRAGESVLLSGTLYTARDAAHARIVKLLQEGDPLPFDIGGATIYYTGPCPARPGEAAGSCGPTTAYRMDAYTPELLSAGLLGMIGKGARSERVRAEIARAGAVYFAAVGGAGALYAGRVTECGLIAFPELGAEAVYRMTVRDFPVIVAVDSEGKDIYQK